MFSRVTLLEIDTLRVTMEEATALFHEVVLPRLEQLDGYAGVLVLATPEGKGLLVSVWETEEAARASAAFASQELERYVTLFRAPPGREQYEVVLADLPEVALA